MHVKRAKVLNNPTLKIKAKQLMFCTHLRFTILILTFQTFMKHPVDVCTRIKIENDNVRKINDRLPTNQTRK